jgi:NAD(P)-dependent dehydrogenase (short-subunit alcohol dehydrogenase family)
MAKIALVTGASSGLGQAISQALGGVGYQLILTSRTNTSDQKIITADLSSLLSINRLIDSVKKQIKKLDVIVNVAGIWHGKNEVYAGKNLTEFSEKTVIDTMTVGAVAPLLLCYHLLPLMPPKSHIINISGTFESGAKGWLPYFVSKRAIEDLTIGLAQDMAEKQIQVNGISPSDMATQAYKKFFPQFYNDGINPNLVAREVVKLVSTFDPKLSGKIFVMKKGQKSFTAFHY